MKLATSVIGIFSDMAGLADDGRFRKKAEVAAPVVFWAVRGESTAGPSHFETCLSPMTFRLRYVRQSRLFPLFAIPGKIGN